MSSTSDLEKSSHPPDSLSRDEHRRSQYEIQLGDGEDPKSFSPLYKAFITWEMSMLAFVGSLGSSIMSPAQADLAAYLNTSEQLTVLSLSLFVLGLTIPWRYYSIHATDLHFQVTRLVRLFGHR